ncbi:AbrB family transcriptional regulator [Salipiger thiooxidans]|uniref:AbrB family transcriptional regulator n=1 Tax=Salipiger thiooxidans TaxID=282683 RepID=UPI001A8D1D92|nr:AbrB family transcriptional regulator [Salipiger thiooxidans]MBN8188222.1 AbrB family transcriptional regulator [Salipiger thiooxidans]
MTQVLGGSITAFPGDFPDVRGFVEAGDIRIVAVLSSERPEQCDQDPTALAQSPDVTGPNWSGLYVRKGISDEAGDMWNQPTQQMVASEEFQMVIGMNVGGRFLGLDVWRLAAPTSAACSVFAVQITLAVPAALMMSGGAGADPLSLRLADAPGGLAETSLIAIAMGCEVAFVGVYHVIRVLLSLDAPAPQVRRADRDMG